MKPEKINYIVSNSLDRKRIEKELRFFSPIIGGKVLGFLFLAFGIFAEDGHLSHKSVSLFALANYSQTLPEAEVRELEKLISREKFREYLPKIGVSYFGLKNKNENQSDSRYDEYRLHFQQLLYDGGENARQREILLLSARMDGEDRRYRLNKFLLESQKVYFKCLTNNLRKLFSYKSKEKAKLNHRVLAKELELGTKRKIDTLESELKLRESESQLLKSNLGLEESNSELSRILGLERKEIVLRENILSDFILISPEPYLNTELSSDSPEVKKAKIILEKSKNEKESSENYWKPKLYVGGYYAKNSTDSLVTRHPAYGVDFTVVLPLGSSSLQSNGRYGIQEDGTGIQRTPGFGPQYVGSGDNSYNSSNLQLFDNLAHSRKILEGEIRTNDAKRNLQEISLKTESERIKITNKLISNYENYKNNYLRVILKIEYYRQSNLSIKLGFQSRLDVYNAEWEVYKSLIELGESIAEYIVSVYEINSFNGTDNLDQYFLYSKGKAHLELKKILEDESK